MTAMTLYDTKQVDSAGSIYVLLAIETVLIVAINTFCVIREQTDATISNSALFSFYTAFTLKQFWTTISNIKPVTQISLQSPSDTLMDIFSTLMEF